MHGTLQPTMRSRGAPDDAGDRFWTRLRWAALVPLLLLLRPYEGLIQDARIYIGRGVADHDPLGVGQDLLFKADGQTGFTALRFVVRGLLGILPAAQVSIILALAGGLVWLAAVATTMRGIARERLAWAATVCVLALPADYGSFQTFVYGETVATPRVFAEAAVLGAIAALLARRRILAFGLLALALALHPLMTLPGLGIAVVLLVAEDRRWILPVGAAAAALAVGVALRLPLADRLITPMDATWLAILKERSVNLFPSLWPLEAFARIGVRLAAVLVVATIATPRVRALMLAVAIVAVGGLALTVAFGDKFPLVLVAQLQTWRALWPLALFGNAAVALAAFGLWTRGAGARLTLAVLALSWVSLSQPLLSIILGFAAVALALADRKGKLTAVSSRIADVALVAASVAIAIDTAASAAALFKFLAAAHAADGEAIYALMLVPGVQIWPLVIAAVVIALRPAPPGEHRRIGRVVMLAALGCAFTGGVWLWDSRTAEYRVVDARGPAGDELRRLLGPAPGPILWIDSYNETWFLADRPSFFDKMQGGPILFSRPLALEWFARGEALVRLGLARPTDVSPWTPQTAAVLDLPLAPDAVRAFCDDPHHPAALVAPGAQLDAVPHGMTAGLWHPPAPIQSVAGNGSGLHWRKIDTFTVIQCGGSDPATPPT